MQGTLLNLRRRIAKSPKGRPTRLTTLVLAGGAREDGVDAWFDKAKLFDEPSPY
ncbi:MAG: hypothetical protein ACYC6R_02980 [Anaerolineales bacterium]